MRLGLTVPDLPALAAKRAKGKKAWRFYWPDNYTPVKREGWQWVSQPLTSGRELKLPRYMQVGSHGYTRVVPNRLEKVMGWLTKHGFTVTWEDKNHGKEQD